MVVLPRRVGDLNYGPDPYAQIKVVEARLLALLLRDQHTKEPSGASASSMFKDILSAAVKEREEEEVRSMWASEPDHTSVPHVPLVNRGLAANPSDPESSSARLVQLTRNIK